MSTLIVPELPATEWLGYGIDMTKVDVFLLGITPDVRIHCTIIRSHWLTVHLLRWRNI